MNSKEFIEFLKDQLNNNNIEITLESKFKSLPDWDSLTAMLLITNLKEDFNIELSVKDLNDCLTVKDIYDLINNK